MWQKVRIVSFGVHSFQIDGFVAKITNNWNQFFLCLSCGVITAVIIIIIIIVAYKFRKYCYLTKIKNHD